LTPEQTLSERASRRLDQWLWFARLAKSRSQAARLCLTGEITVNGIPVTRARHPVRAGDTIELARPRIARRLTVLALGRRRGPPPEARALYGEAEPIERPAPPLWIPLLADEPEQVEQN
jgi:ribosome-associated heat shock protein Hsp15